LCGLAFQIFSGSIFLLSETSIFGNRDRRRLRRDNLAADTQRNVRGPSALQVTVTD
jgi:hypothetical protein